LVPLGGNEFLVPLGGNEFWCRPNIPHRCAIFSGMNQPDRAVARRLAQESLAKGDALGWFETLYAAADGDATRIPWADLHPNRSLVDWLDRTGGIANGRRALVIGCGLGDDAEELTDRGFAVTAFDVSAGAVAWCRRRFAMSRVNYCAADLLNLPAAWRQAFDFVLEIYTLQVLPNELRPTAIAQMADCVAPGGTLLIVARGRQPADDPGSMPWPLLREEVAELGSHGLWTASFEEYFDDEDPPVRRFRVEHCRPRA
ncbi:MAG TPA: class I SAM-dependent methyltransferase, partial [Pirellulales bacterium]|nr:class I SAM-dependent methyltransferase [Pirellulales bacterium]